MSSDRKTMDQIRLSRITLNTVIGVNPRERKTPQPVNVDLTLHLDLRAAGRRDRLRDTIDYAALVQRVRKVASKSHFRLLESLAEALAGLCLREKRVAAVDVTVEKPQALPGIGVAVTISRSR
ncbi:MAG: dihydroneopterin aldolase [Lentisphaerae bacterium]|nr:dihydroneopterin aldolase [Lentisphaerota bacterium]